MYAIARTPRPNRTAEYEIKEILNAAARLPRWRDIQSENLLDLGYVPARAARKGPAAPNRTAEYEIKEILDAAGRPPCRARHPEPKSP